MVGTDGPGCHQRVVGGRRWGKKISDKGWVVGLTYVY